MAKYKVPKIQEMIDAGVHFGHQTKRWHPKMEPYIYTVSKGVHIIDLEKTEEMLRKACDFLYEQASMGKVIVFVGTKKQSKDIIEKEAKRSGALYVNERWVGGTITNFETIKKNIDKLLGYLKSREEGKFLIYTKKERLLIDREIEKLQASYGGISSLRKTPEVLFVIDTKREKTAIREAKRSGVPVVAIVDTNANPEDIDYPIPGNDDAIKSVALIVRAIADAVEEGYKEFGKSEKEKREKKEIEEKESSFEKKEEIVPEEIVVDVEEKLVNEAVKEENEIAIKESSADNNEGKEKD
ncbi:MAG TPA: 30S ribosomal protein S2 [bacterium]|nr:30S ribosomal protein S2 [bacterium]